MFSSSTSKATTKKTKRRQAYDGYDDEVDTGDIFNAEQQELLDLIEKEDVNEVREFFARGLTFDVSRGEIGRVALRSAICNERADIAEILLQNGVRIGNALFTAVIEGSRECVELFLDGRFFGAGDIGPTDQREGFFMSPLMLAVRLGDHDIIQYMVFKGFQIEQPNNLAQEHQDGKNQEEMQFLSHINSYRALANPLYMAYSYFTILKVSTQYLEHSPCMKSLIIKPSLIMNSRRTISSWLKVVRSLLSAFWSSAQQWVKSRF